MSDGTALILTENERNSAVWMRIEEYLNARLDLLRRLNDSPAPHEDTIRTRASISEIKKMLAAGETQD